jgi:hypothetical protein
MKRPQLTNTRKLKPDMMTLNYIVPLADNASKGKLWAIDKLNEVF